MGCEPNQSGETRDPGRAVSGNAQSMGLRLLRLQDHLPRDRLDRGARGMKIGIDIDDVLADSLPHYTRAFNQRFGLQIDLADAAWRIFDRFPRGSRQEAHDFFSGLIEAGFFSSRPLMPGAKAAVESLAEDGHRPFSMTGPGPPEAAI